MALATLEHCRAREKIANETGLHGVTGSTAVNNLIDAAGGEIKVMTYNFPLSAYGAEAVWNKWLRKQRKKECIIKIIGGPEVEAKRYVDELLREDIAKIRILQKPVTKHFVIVSSPQQLWVEEYHEKGLALDCTYTPAPDPLVWSQVNRIFDALWNGGALYIPD